MRCKNSMGKYERTGEKMYGSVLEAYRAIKK